jgi:hypothetical protein
MQSLLVSSAGLQILSTPDVNMAIFATMTYQYFKLQWLLSSLSDQRNCLQSLLVSTASNTAVDSVAQCAEPKSDDTDDDYYMFTESTDTNTSVISTASATAKYMLEVFQFLEDSRKEITMLNNYSFVKTLFVQFNAVLPSSAPVEHLFSFTGLITRLHRRKMSEKHLSSCLY